MNSHVFKVSELDEGLLKFHNLEELAVTANLISTVHSENIPKSVKVIIIEFKQYIFM